MSLATEERIKAAFGKAVRNARVEKGLSQEKLAEQAEIHRTYIGEVERGLRNVAIVNMQRIAVALDIPLSLLVEHCEAILKKRHAL